MCVQVENCLASEYSHIAKKGIQEQLRPKVLGTQDLSRSTRRAIISLQHMSGLSACELIQVSHRQLPYTVDFVPSPCKATTYYPLLLWVSGTVLGASTRSSWTCSISLIFSASPSGWVNSNTDSHDVSLVHTDMKMPWLLKGGKTYSQQACWRTSSRSPSFGTDSRCRRSCGSLSLEGRTRSTQPR
jgi:hypothetical protein